MKKILKVIIFAIIFYLCIVPYQCTKAENETDSETPTQTETNSQETESNQNEENKPEDSSTLDENTTKEENETQPTDPEPSNPSGVSETTSGTGNASSTSRTTQRQSQAQTATKAKSSNANLVNLGMIPNDFKGFKPGIFEYNVTVPNDVEKVNVYAKVQDAKAQITSGTGDQNLSVGNNAIKIVVTAENGDTQTYTINVTREEVIQEEVENKEVVAYSDLKNLEIKGYKLTPNFSADIYEYKLDIKQDVTDLEVVTEGLNDKVNIEVVGNTDLKER